MLWLSTVSQELKSCYSQGIIKEAKLNNMYKGDSQNMFDVVQFAQGQKLKIDTKRDDNLTDFGKATLTDRYLMPGEDFQDLFARVSSYYGDDDARAASV